MTRLDDLLQELDRLPPPTAGERRTQRMSFAYGNLACTTNHKPSRSAFRFLALEEGWTESEWDEFAAGKEWLP